MASRQAFLLRSFQRSSGNSNRLLPQRLQLSKQLFAHMSAFTPAITKLVKRTVDALPVARGSVLLGPCLDLFNQRQTLGLVLSGLTTDLVQPSLDHLVSRIAGFVKLFPQRMVGCAALVRLLPLLTQLTQRFLHLAATQGLALRAIEQPFGFGDQASTSSHLVPRATILRRTGLVGERDFRVVHVGTHDAVARTVQSGRAPVGALSEPIFHSLLARNVIQRERLVDVAFSDPIPNYPMVMQGNLAPDLKQAIRDAFLNLRDPALLRNFRVEGFAATNDAAYDVLRETARILNLDLGRMS
jgi:hypothetical protein